MGLFDSDHLVGMPTAVGPTAEPSSWADVFSANFEAQTTVDSSIGLENELRRRWAESLNAAGLEVNTQGRAGNDLSASAFNQFISSKIDPNQERNAAWFFSDFGGDQEEKDKVFADIMATNEQVKALRNPKIKSLDQLFEEVRAEFVQNDARRTDANENRGWFGWVPMLAGGLAGSFTTANPENLLTLPIGGFGKSVAARLLSEGAVNAAVEGLVQETSIQPQRAALGLQEDNEWMSIATAGLGGAAFRGIFEGAGALVARRAARIDVENAAVAEAARLDFDQTLLDSPNPSHRAAGQAYAEQVHFDTHNPYGMSDYGARKFEAETADIYNLMSGRTDTAVARFLPEQEFSISQVDFDTAVVKAERPLLFEQLDATQSRIAELDTAINELTIRIDEPRASDVAEMFDPELGARIREIEDEIINGDFTDARRGTEVTQLNTQLRAMLDREIGDAALRSKIADAIDAAEEPGLNEAVKRSRRQAVYELSKKLENSPYSKALAKRDVELRNNLATLRRERDAAVKDFSATRDVMDQEIARVRQVRQFKERTAAKQISLSYAPDPAFGNMQLLRPDVVASFIRTTNETAETLDDSIEAAVSSMIVEGEDGAKLVDLGNGRVVAADTRLPDPDNPENEISVGELAVREQADSALLEAMRTCAV